MAKSGSVVMNLVRNNDSEAYRGVGENELVMLKFKGGIVHEKSREDPKHKGYWAHYYIQTR